MTTKKVLITIWASCDLLKIHYLCDRNDNNKALEVLRAFVVICSKFITFVHCCPVKIVKYHLSSNSLNTVLVIQALI